MWRSSSSSRMMIPYVTEHFTFILLAGICVDLVVQVERLRGTYELVNILGLLAGTHFFRFIQLLMEAVNKHRPPQALLFHDLPITAAIAGFYITFHVFSTAPDFVLCLALNLLVLVLMFMSRRMEVEQEGDAVKKQDAAVNSISSSTTDFSRWWETEDLIQVTDLLTITFMAWLCVLLMVEAGRLKGRYEPGDLLRLLTTVPISGFIRRRQNKDVRRVYCLPKVLLFYELPITASTVAFYIACRTCSDSSALKTCQSIYFLDCIYTVILKFASIPKVLKREDVSPTQASSLNTDELLHQQNHDAAAAANNSISCTSNFSQWEIYEPLIGAGDGRFAHVRAASDRSITRDLSEVKEEEAAAAANSISETTNFNRWEKGESIGAGGFGTVFVARNRESRDLLCAIKELKNTHKLENVESIRKEIDILRKLKHPNIVQYYDHEIVGRHISLCMEYVETGSLKKYISERGVLHEPLIRNFTAQILSGLVYLHSKRVVHRDLKPDNLLVDSDDVVKLVDFGLAKHLAESVGKHSQLGTPYYAAPEVLKKIEYKSSREASAADIWSLGCVIIEMFSGKHPWPGFEPVQAFYNVCFKQQHPPIPQELCSESKDFLRLCFVRTPAKRPSAGTLLEHPFVKPQTL